MPRLSLVRRLAPLVALALLALTGRAPAAAAQAVETPIPFDGAGRVLVITPAAAARARLMPPAWRVTGDFAEARLYRNPAGGYLLAVTRRTGAVERYPLTAADVAQLRARTTGLSPDVTRGTDHGVRTRFIVSQSLLGLGVYAPSFAYAVSNGNAGRGASWLLVSGMTYFAATAVSREFPISAAQNRLATHAGLHGGAFGLGTGYALDLPKDGRAVLAFAGGVGGTAAGLYLGRTMTPDEAAASAVGADVAALAALGLTTGIGVDSDRTRVGAAVAAGIAGYPLGLLYARTVPHNVTEGDMTALLAAAAAGALAATPFVTNASDDARALALTIGGAVGLVAGDRLLVGRFDHSAGDGALVALGAGAGALMGAGVAALIDDDGSSNDRLVLGLAAVGSVAGIAISEALLVPAADAGRFALGARLNPLGLALAAGGARGRHTLLHLSF